MRRRNIITLIIAAVVILAAGVFAGWYYMNYGPGTPQNYLNDRRASASGLVQAGLSKTLSDAVEDTDSDDVVPEKVVENISNSCDSVQRQVDKLPDAIPDDPDTSVGAVEGEYPIAELREDARYYRGLCEYLVQNEQFNREIDEVRSADIYTYNFTRDCADQENCQRFAREDELAEYIKTTVMPVHERAVSYHESTECPFRFSGGEQLCNGIGNTYRAERAYDGGLMRLLERPPARMDDSSLEQNDKTREDAIWYQQQFLEILGSYETIYDVYIEEFAELEAKFAAHP